MTLRTAYRTGTAALLLVLIEAVAWATGIALWWSLERFVPAFRFARPWVLWGLLAGAVLVLLYLLDLWRRNRALRRFSEPLLLTSTLGGLSTTRSLLRFLTLRHAFSFAVLALAGPQLGTRVEEVKAQGVDVIVALDVSNSMLAQDLPPSRMEMASRALAQLVDRMKGDRLGIVVFAGEAYTQLPLTADRSAARLFLSNLGPELVPTQGTAIGAAIDLAREGFPEEAGGSRAIIVITDGENHEDDALGAAERAREAGILVHTIGMGTPQGGPIPELQRGRVAGYKKDREGRTVVSRLNEAMLEDIAAAGGGAYVRATVQGTGIDALVAELRGMDQTETGTYRFAGHEDQFQSFLAIAILLIFAGLLLGEGSGTRKRTIAT